MPMPDFVKADSDPPIKKKFGKEGLDFREENCSSRKISIAAL